MNELMMIDIATTLKIEKSMDMCAMINDCAVGRSSAVLQVIGLPLNKIHIVEIDKKICEIHKKRGYHVINKDFIKFVSNRKNCRLNKDPFNIVITDIEFSIHKARVVTFLMIQKNFIGRDTYFSITIAKRIGRCGGNFDEEFQSFKRMIHNELKKRNLQMVEMRYEQYGNPRKERRATMIMFCIHVAEIINLVKDKRKINKKRKSNSTMINESHIEIVDLVKKKKK